MTISEDVDHLYQGSKRRVGVGSLGEREHHGGALADSVEGLGECRRRLLPGGVEIVQDREDGSRRGAGVLDRSQRVGDRRPTRAGVVHPRPARFYAGCDLGGKTRLADPREPRHHKNAARAAASLAPRAPRPPNLMLARDKRKTGIEFGGGRQEGQ